jgi:hypothetical protein
LDAGVFLPRYRCFNILNSASGTAAYPVLSETFGALFRCYPPKIAPKLPPSTELTNHLAKMGFSVNVRGEDDRQPRNRRNKKKVEDASSDAVPPDEASTSIAAGKRKADDQNDEFLEQDGDADADGSESE